MRIRHSKLVKSQIGVQNTKRPQKHHTFGCQPMVLFVKGGTHTQACALFGNRAFKNIIDDPVILKDEIKHFTPGQRQDLYTANQTKNGIMF